MNRTYRRALSFFAFGLLIASGCSHMAMSQSAVQPKIGQPAVWLSKSENYGYYVRNLDPAPQAPSILGRILAIDGINLRGKSDRKIENLLRGAIGTSVGITLLDDGEVRTIKLRRDPAKRYGDPAVTDLTQIFQDFDHEIVGIRADHLGDWLAKQNLDVLAQAQTARFMDTVQNLPGDNGAIVAVESAKTVIVLDDLGRFSNADKLLKIVLQNPVSETDAARRSKHQPPDQIKEQRSLSTASTLSAQIWLAQGNQKKALAGMTSVGASKLRLDDINTYCFYGCQIARLMEKQGEIDKAIQVIQEVLQRFRTSTIKDERLIAEKIPAYYPTESDLETQLAQLYLKKSNYAAAKGSAESAVQRIESALGPNNVTLRQPLTVLAEALQGSGFASQADVIRKRANKLPPLESKSQTSETSHPDLFALLKEARTASGADLKQDLGKLEDAYAEPIGLISGVITASDNNQLNLFCALVETARNLSDRKLYSESNGVLEFLKHASEAEARPAVSGLIELERAINSAREGKTTADPWTRAIEAFPLSPHAMAVSSRTGLDKSAALTAAIKGEEVFRVMAVAYALAGHNDRAKMLIDRALAQMKAIELTAQLKSPADQSALARTKTFLLLDAARIKALTGDLADAQAVGEQAVTLCASTLPAPMKEARNFNETYRLKIAQLGLAMKKHGSPNLATEQLLAFAQSNISKGASADVELEPDTSPRYDGGYYALIDALMARLFLEDENLPEANRHATQSVEMLGMDSFSAWKRAADVAYKSGDFDAAAHRYSEAEKNCVFFRAGDYCEKEKAECLQKAAESAAKATNLNKVEAANIYIRRAATIERTHRVEAYYYYEKAYELTPDSDPGKSRLLGIIAEFKATIASNAELSLLKPSAILAENANSPLARSQWQKVSLMEVNAGMLSEAFVDAKHALSIRLQPSQGNSLGGIEISADYGLIPGLAKIGRSADAEALLQDGLKVVRSTYGEQSPAAAAQLAQLIIFYFDENDNAKAFQSLHELLSFDLRTIEVGLRHRDSAQATLEDYASALVTKGKGELAVQILQKILEAQRKTFEPDNERIALSLLNLAEVESAMNKTEEAKQHALEAARIFTLYNGILHVWQSAGGRFKYLWGKLDPGYEAKTFDVRQLDFVNTEVLRMLGDEKDAAQIEQFQRMPAGYVDPFKAPVSVDAKASPAAKLIQWQKRYAITSVVAPYSSSSAWSLAEQMRIALDSRDWETLAKAATARAIIYEHEPDVAAGRQQGCVAPPTVRLDYYKNAAKAYIALGEIETAQKWLDRGIKALAAKTPTEWITFAELELECGKPDRAAQYADLADKLWWADDYDAYWYPEHSEALWEKLGQPERAKSILAKSEEMKNMRLQQEKQSEKSVLYGTSR